jgi:hypothetical protein
MQGVHDMTSPQPLMEVSKALAAQLWNALKDDPHTNTIVTSQDQITFSTPKTAVTGKKKLAIFLYSVTLDQAHKNVPSATGAGITGARQADYATRYLIAPCTGNAENDLLLLWKIIQTLSDKPILETGAPENGDNKLSLTLDSLSIDDLSKLWMALEEPLRPSLSVTAAFAGEASLRQTAPTLALIGVSPRILELYQTVFETFEQQTNDWKSRNLFQRQYVQSDFSKNTSMTVDAMRAELRELGDKLHTNRPIEPYIEALKRLREFYEHQLDVLKGFEKVQKKRREGIDMVAKWKADVEALLDGLGSKAES